MFYEVSLDDDTYILFEGQASGAMSKGGDGPSKFIPMDAFKNSLKAVGQITKRLDDQMQHTMIGSDTDWQIEFSVRADGNGTVMLAQTPDIGQFKITLKSGT